MHLHGGSLHPGFLWIYCPGHAGVGGNEQADRLASTADITSGLQLGRAEVLRGLGNFLTMDRPEHHSIDRLKERGVEKGSGRHSTLRGRERSVFNQTNIVTVSRVTLGRLLRDGAERVWAFLSATMSSWAKIETDAFGDTRVRSHCSVNHGFIHCLFSELLIFMLSLNVYVALGSLCWLTGVNSFLTITKKSRSGTLLCVFGSYACHSWLAEEMSSFWDRHQGKTVRPSPFYQLAR